MNEELNEFKDSLDDLVPVPGVIGVYWSGSRKCWRIQLDNEVFLREIVFWDENKAPGCAYPYELVAAYGTVEVFCLVRGLPA